MKFASKDANTYVLVECLLYGILFCIKWHNEVVLLASMDILLTLAGLIAAKTKSKIALVIFDSDQYFTYIASVYVFIQVVVNPYSLALFILQVFVAGYAVFHSYTHTIEVLCRFTLLVLISFYHPAILLK